MERGWATLEDGLSAKSPAAPAAAGHPNLGFLERKELRTSLHGLKVSDRMWENQGTTLLSDYSTDDMEEATTRKDPAQNSARFRSGETDRSNRRNELDSVYVLWHVHHIGDRNDDEKLIGVYRTEDDVSATIARLQNKPGFRESREGFQVETYELNQDHWTEGYASV